MLLDFSKARAAQKAKYGSEFFPAEAAAMPDGTQYLDCFQLSRKSKTNKGIIALELKGLQP